MSLRIQISLLFIAGGLVLSDAAQAATSFTVSGVRVDLGTFSTVGRPHDQ